MTSLQGNLLIAVPQLPDPNFFKTVVLIIHHDEQGALGVVLNRTSRRTLAEVWPKIAGESCSSNQPINLGGPVSGQLMAVHTRADLAEQEVLPGVYFSAEKACLLQLVGEQDGPFLIFSGYSGWGEGQLESELKDGAWLTVDAQADQIFEGDEELWGKVAKNIADDVISELNIKHVPPDPWSN